PGMAQVRNPRHLPALEAACRLRGVCLMPEWPVRRLVREGGRVVGGDGDQGRRGGGEDLVEGGGRRGRGGRRGGGGCGGWGGERGAGRWCCCGCRRRGGRSCCRGRGTSCRARMGWCWSARRWRTWGSIQRRPRKRSRGCWSLRGG